MKQIAIVAALIEAALIIYYWPVISERLSTF